jgi:hypothetical protein
MASKSSSASRDLSCAAGSGRRSSTSVSASGHFKRFLYSSNRARSGPAFHFPTAAMAMRMAAEAITAAKGCNGGRTGHSGQVCRQKSE